MNDSRTVLTDTEQRIWLEAFHLEGEEPDEPWSIDKWTIRGGPGDGIDVIDIDNGCLSVSVLPTRGMGLWKARCDDLSLGWDSPVRRPVHPSLVRTADAGGIGWLGGFNELLARCGLASHGAPGVDHVSDAKGATTEVPVTLHGRIANLPAHKVEVGTDGDGRLWVRGEIDETMLFGPCLHLASTFATHPGSNRISLHDRITNLSGREAEFEVLYHTNIGRPLLGPGARLVAPARRVIPRNQHAADDIRQFDVFASPDVDYVEQCYFLELQSDDADRTLVVLHDAGGQRGLALEYAIHPLPCFTLWKNTMADADGYVAGIEPSTDYPNPREFERANGRVPTLAPGASWDAHIDFVALTTPEEVNESVARVKSLLGETSTRLVEMPLPHLCPAD
jgi:hypothetical protein